MAGAFRTIKKPGKAKINSQPPRFLVLQYISQHFLLSQIRGILSAFLYETYARQSRFLAKPIAIQYHSSLPHLLPLHI